MLVFGAAPDDEAHPGRGFGLVAHREGQSVEPDDVRGGSGVDVAVRRESQSEMRVPATAGADGVEVALYVLHHRLGRFAGQHALEMLPSEIVLPFEEEGAGQFEPWPGTIGMEDENTPQGGDGRVQQGFTGLFIKTGRARCANARQSRQQEHFHVVRIGLHQRSQNLERFQVASILDQFFGIFDAGLQRCRHQQKNGEHRQQTQHGEYYRM